MLSIVLYPVIALAVIVLAVKIIAFTILVVCNIFGSKEEEE